MGDVVSKPPEGKARCNEDKWQEVTYPILGEDGHAFFGHILLKLKKYPRWESNPNLRFRKPSFYPLNYKGAMFCVAKIEIYLQYSNAELPKSGFVPNFNCPASLRCVMWWLLFNYSLKGCVENCMPQPVALCSSTHFVALLKSASMYSFSISHCRRSTDM